MPMSEKERMKARASIEKKEAKRLYQARLLAWQCGAGAPNRKQQRLTQREVREGIDLSQDEWLIDEQAKRPKVRSDCVDATRPCPWLRCRYHLAVEPTKGGDFKVMDLEKMNETCVLDVVDKNPNGLGYAEIAKLIGKSRQFVQQIASSAYDTAKKKLKSSGITLEHIRWIEQKKMAGSALAVAADEESVGGFGIQGWLDKNRRTQAEIVDSRKKRKVKYLARKILKMRNANATQT